MSLCEKRWWIHSFSFQRVKPLLWQSWFDSFLENNFNRRGYFSLENCKNSKHCKILFRIRPTEASHLQRFLEIRCTIFFVDIEFWIIKDFLNFCNVQRAVCQSLAFSMTRWSVCFKMHEYNSSADCYIALENSSSHINHARTTFSFMFFCCFARFVVHLYDCTQ